MRHRSIGDDSSLLDNGIIDSLGILEIVTFIEVEFHLLLTDEDVVSDNFETINSLAELVATKLSRDTRAAADD